MTKLELFTRYCWLKLFPVSTIGPFQVLVPPPIAWNAVRELVPTGPAPLPGMPATISDSRFRVTPEMVRPPLS